MVYLTTDQNPRLALSRVTDLVVIGRRGAGLAKRTHLGSTAEWLMIHPPAPLLIARHGRAVRSVVVCHDGSSHACAATDALARMPWVDNVLVTLVVVDDGRALIRDVVRAAGESLAEAGADLRHTVLRGEATHELLEHLESVQPDLVVLGTRGLAGWERFRVGSTAGVIAHATERSVLLACDEFSVQTELSPLVARQPDGDRSGGPISPESLGLEST